MEVEKTGEQAPDGDMSRNSQMRGESVAVDDQALDS